MTDFNILTEKLLEKSVDSIPDKSSLVQLYSATFNFEGVGGIDFATLDLEEILYFKENVYEIIREETEDGEIRLDENHPFAQLISLEYKTSHLVRLPMQRIPSPYRFI